MKAVQEIKQAVGALSREELASFREWFFEFDAEVWACQLEEDGAAGRLDGFVAEPHAAPTGKRLRELPELLASVPHLSEREAEALADDIAAAKAELPRLPLNPDQLHDS